jgi:hypothetical protein
MVDIRIKTKQITFDVGARVNETFTWLGSPRVRYRLVQLTATKAALVDASTGIATSIFTVAWNMSKNRINLEAVWQNLGYNDLGSFAANFDFLRKDEVVELLS